MENMQKVHGEWGTKLEKEGGGRNLEKYELS